MPTRPVDLLTYLLLIGVLVLAFMGIQGCAAAPVPAPKLNDLDRIPYSATVFLRAGDGRCSGVAIGDHHFLTAAHCVETGPFEVEAFPGVRGVAEVVHVYEDRDAALMKTGIMLESQAKIALEKPTSGDLLVVAGFGCLEDNLFVTAGVYLGPGPVTGMYLVAASICPGDSGGPVFNRAGEVVALVSGRNIELPVMAAAPTEGL